MHNFMSYRHAELDLEGLGYTIISGQNHKTTDSAKSNGSGKSTIFNAVCYALTGETTQGIKNNIENIYSDPNDCWVELTFKVDDSLFVLKRIKTPKSDLKITIDGVDYSGKGITESTKMLEQFIPDLTSMLVGSIIILGQGLPYRFADNLPCRRKEILEKLTKSDYMIQSIREKLDQRKIELSAQLRMNEDKLVANNTQVDMYNKQLVEYSKEIEEIVSYNTEYSLDNRLEYLGEKITRLNNELAEAKKDNEANTKAYEKYTNERTSLLTTSANEKAILTKDVDNELLELNNKLVEIKTNITAKTAEIKKLEAITDICPTCGQKIPGANKVDTEPYKQELKELKEQKDSFDKSYKAKQKTKEEMLVNFDQDLKMKLDGKDALLDTCKHNSQTFNDLVDTLTAKINKAIAEQAKVQSMKDNYDKLSNNVANINTTVSELGKEKEKLEAIVFETKEHIKVISDLFSLTKREFRGVLLENVINYINMKVKQYSTKVFGAELVSFMLNENDIDIIFNDRMYESLSGGEKQKVDIIIQFALRDLLSAHIGLHTNILVLDEIFDNLDSVGCQKIIDLISELNDIDSIFIISHHVNELQISYDSEILVEKGENGCSSISIR